jgi:hypothetical protein
MSAMFFFKNNKFHVRHVFFVNEYALLVGDKENLFDVQASINDDCNNS